MKKTNKQRRHEEKNWRAKYHVLIKPYMKPHFRHVHKKLCNRFKMDKFRSIVASIIAKHDAWELFQGRCATYSKGVHVSFPEKKVRIINTI